MAKKDKKTTKTKVKKKVWYSIIAPKTFGSKPLGESYLTNPDVAVGRTIKINLRDVTGNMKDQNVYVRFKIIKVEGSTLQTSTTGYELTPAYVKRVVRKNTSRIDEYFKLKLKTGQEVILKGLLITIRRTQRSLGKELRRQLQELLEKELKTHTFESLVSVLVNNKLRTDLRKKLTKIYPLREVAIRVLKLVEKKEAAAQPESVPEKPEPAAEEMSVEAQPEPAEAAS